MNHIIDWNGKPWKAGDRVTFKYLNLRDWQGQIEYFISANMVRVKWDPPHQHHSTELITHLERIEDDGNLQR